MLASACCIVHGLQPFPGLPRAVVSSAAEAIEVVEAVGTSSPTPPTQCEVGTTTCSMVANKVPPVTRTPAAGPSVETDLALADKAAFEHLLGRALRQSEPVCWITREVGVRLAAFLRAAAALLGSTYEDELRAAFVTPQCGVHNTGYVGPSVQAIRRALEHGNIREVWGLMYVLTKSERFSTLLLELLRPRAAGQPALATAASLQATLGMNATAIERRWAEVAATARINSTSLRYSQGAPDFLFEPFDSWVRFDFEARALDGVLLWGAARTARHGGCASEGLMSDDASVWPPLSEAELAYQCGEGAAPGDEGGEHEGHAGHGGDGEEAGGGGGGPSPPPSPPRPARCALQWWPGKLCYDVVEAPLDGTPGYAARAAALGYRAVAGPSGTTANMLQLARLLGLGADDEAVLVRLAMVAWMVPTNDHSLFEIMLGAEPHMAPPFRLALGIDDLGRLWPRGQQLRSSSGGGGGGGGVAFGAAGAWRPVARALASAEGRRLLAAMRPDAAEYVAALVGGGGGGGVGGGDDEGVEEGDEGEPQVLEDGRVVHPTTAHSCAQQEGAQRTAESHVEARAL